MTSAPDRRPRWAQLSYTSLDSSADDGRAGGWQIKERTGDLTADEARYLVTHCANRLDFAEKPPEFPTPADIAALPRRLAYAPITHGGGYWHVAAAGADATRRPGNVFLHALLDREPGSTARPRPIEYWKSLDWLTPYGAEHVAMAEFRSAERPAPGDSITRDAAIDWVLSTTEWRVGLYIALVDAVAGGLAGGPPTVLSCDSPDTAAQWIGAVSFLFVPTTAARFGFSTFERARTVADAHRYGATLLAVPREDLDALPADLAAIVLDEHDVVALGHVGDIPHTTTRGTRVPASEWGTVIESAFQSRESAHAVLMGVDAQAERTCDADALWTVAAVMRADGDLHRDLTATLDEIFLDRAPHNLEHDDDASFKSYEQLRRDRLPGGPRARWQALVEAPRDGRLADLVEDYLFAAAADPTWLTGERPPPPSRVRLANPSDALVEAMAHKLKALAPAPNAARAEDATPVLRLIELLVTSGLAQGAGPLRPSIDRVIAGRLVPLLYRDAVGAAALADSGPYADETVALLRDPIESRLREHAGVVGDRLAAGLVELLTRQVAFADVQRRVEDGEPVEELVLERLVQRWTDATIEPTDAAHYAALALWVLFGRGAVVTQHAAARLLREHRVLLDPLDAYRLLQAFPAALPLRTVMAAVGTKPWSGIVAELCRLVEGDWLVANAPDRADEAGYPPQLVADIAALRLASHDDAGAPTQRARKLFKHARSAEALVEGSVQGDPTLALVVGSAVMLDLGRFTESGAVEAPSTSFDGAPLEPLTSGVGHAGVRVRAAVAASSRRCSACSSRARRHRTRPRRSGPLPRATGW